MPELPEVETVLRALEVRVRDAEISDIIVRWPKVIDGDPDEFVKILKGQHFREFRRRGKYLLFTMDDCLLVSHLRMEGKYFIKTPEELDNLREASRIVDKVFEDLIHFIKRQRHNIHLFR